MKKKLLLCLLTLLSTVFFASAQEDKNEAQISKIIERMNSRDVDGLIGMMTDSATIGNLPKGDNRRMLSGILSNFTGIHSYKIRNSSIDESGNIVIEVEVQYPNGKKGIPTFTFDKDRKVTNLGIIKAWTKADPSGVLSNALLTTNMPDTMAVSFQLHQGLIYVPATLNGIDGYFQFDNGCPVVILRKRYVNKVQFQSSVKVDLQGFGGKMNDVKWATGNDLIWGSIKLSAFAAPVADMDEMELDNGMEIFGLLGYGIFKDYQVTIDYGKQKIFLEKTDAQGKLVGPKYEKGKKLEEVAIFMKRHIPIVSLKISGIAYQMGIDCGANANLLQSKILSDLGNCFVAKQSSATVLGVGGNNQNVIQGDLEGASIGNVELSKMYSVAINGSLGMNTDGDQNPLYGLLGTPFLSQFIFSINFNGKRIEIYEKQ